MTSHVYIKRRYARELDEAIVAALATLPAERRNVISFYFVEGLTLERFGAMYNVSRRAGR